MAASLYEAVGDRDRMMKIIAFDPGGTTGYAVGVLEETEGKLYISIGQGKSEHLDLWNQLVAAKPDWLIYEKFDYRNRARAGLELISREYIGIIKLYAAMYEVEIEGQTAAQAMGHFTDSKLKTLGLYQKARPHAMDALRHLLQWYEFGRGFQFNVNGFQAAD